MCEGYCKEKGIHTMMYILYMKWYHGSALSLVSFQQTHAAKVVRERVFVHCGRQAGDVDLPLRHCDRNIQMK